MQAFCSPKIRKKYACSAGYLLHFLCFNLVFSQRHTPGMYSLTYKRDQTNGKHADKMKLTSQEKITDSQFWAFKEYPQKS